MKYVCYVASAQQYVPTVARAVTNAQSSVQNVMATAHHVTEIIDAWIVVCASIVQPPEWASVKTVCFAMIVQ